MEGATEEEEGMELGGGRSGDRTEAAAREVGRTERARNCRAPTWGRGAEERRGTGRELEKSLPEKQKCQSRGVCDGAGEPMAR